MDDFVTVSVRIKPPLNNPQGSSSLQVINKQPAIVVVPERPQIYNFDNVFTENDSQEDVYKETVQLFVEKVKAGYSCTVFAYGQTGTGKTYTIGTNPDVKSYEDTGLICKALEDFFSSADYDDKQLDIEVSFIEIYNEKVFDLLTVNANKVPLTVKGFQVQGYRKVPVSDASEALIYLTSGSRQRHVGETKQNAGSSRSHAIFSIYCHSKGEVETTAKLNLVDLAGSESVKKTGNQGPSLFEGININKGLLSLGQVMTALSTNSSYIPYRQCILTTILKDCLNKKNFVSLIACVSSNPDDLTETLQTLEFSSRVKKMKNKPEVNELVAQYKKDKPDLFSNGVARGYTPSKRSNGYSYETPYKKPKIQLPVVQESVLSAINSASENSLLVYPLFASSTRKNSPEVQTPKNFSPVIKKYMAKLENTIMNRIEDVIANTLKMQNETSRRTNKSKENDDTPVKSFRANSRSISKDFIRDIINQTSRSQASSNSFELSDNEVSNSTHLQSTITMQDTPSENKENEVFRVPTLPIKTKTNHVRRSSVRLQLKKQNTQMNSDNDCRRRSIRLQVKNSENSEDISININEKKQTTNKRRLTKFNSPCRTCIKKGNESKEEVGSPFTLRTKQVLEILNNGTIRELSALHTVGSKTAENILLYRKLRGKFKSVAEIAEMPYWSKKKFEKFVAVNFIRM